MRSINSSSKLQQRYLCPGSAIAELAVQGANTENPFAAEGILLHHHDANPDEPRDALTSEQRDVLVRNAELRTRFLVVELKRLGIPEDARRKEFVEQEFFLCDDEGIPLTSFNQPVPGHPDRVIYFPDHSVAVIFDSKFGRIEVPPAWLNLQLRSYAVMFWENFPCDTITVAITQPWAKAPNDFHSAEYSHRDYPDFKQELISIVRATEVEDAPRHASIEACNHCAACAECPASITVATEVAVLKMDELTVAELESLGDDIALAAKVVERWRDRMKYFALKFPGLLSIYQLGKASNVRFVKDAPAALKFLIETRSFHKESSASFISEEVKHVAVLESLIEHARSSPEEFAAMVAVFLSCVDVSLPRLAEMVAVRQDMSKLAAESHLAAALGDYIITKPKERSLEKKPKDVHALKEVKT